MVTTRSQSLHSRTEQVRVAVHAARRNVAEHTRESFVLTFLEVAKIDSSIFAANPKFRHTCIEKMKSIIYVECIYYEDVKHAMTRLRNKIQQSFEHDSFVESCCDVSDYENLWIGEELEPRAI